MQCLKKCGHPYCIHPWHLVMATSMQIDHVRAQAIAASKRNSLGEDPTAPSVQTSTEQTPHQPPHVPYDDFQQPCSSKSLFPTTQSDELISSPQAIDKMNNLQLETHSPTYITPEVRIVPSKKFLLVPGLGVCVAQETIPSSQEDDEEIIIVDSAVNTTVVECEKLISEHNKTAETFESHTPTSGELVSAMINKAITDQGIQIHPTEEEISPIVENSNVEFFKGPVPLNEKEATPDNGRSHPDEDPSNETYTFEKDPPVLQREENVEESETSINSPASPEHRIDTQGVEEEMLPPTNNNQIGNFCTKDR